MSFWQAENLRSIVSGNWLRSPTAAITAGLCTDTRVIKPGQAFLAIKGDTHDGHDHLAAAADAGASLLIVDDAAKAESAVHARPTGILRVENTRRALLELGAARRQSLPGAVVIAVLGANGKTTTTRLIDSILRQEWRGAASPKSFNNDIGVPLTILAAPHDARYLVCEVGTNHPGEIARLAPVVAPDIAVITSVGRAHIEHFGTLEAIVREDAAIFACLKPSGSAVIPADEPLLDRLVEGLPTVIRFGTSASANPQVAEVRHEPGGAGLTFALADGARFGLPLIGAHNALNAAAAIAVARRLGLDDAVSRAGLASASPADMRLNQRTAAGAKFIVDCYNANPESAASAARAFAEISSGAARRVVVLGDMLELGDHAAAAHREVGELIAHESSAELFITLGPLAEHAARAAQGAAATPAVHCFPALDDHCLRAAAALLQPGDTVLLKASRGSRLERLIPAFESSVTTAPCAPVTESTRIAPQMSR